MHYVNWYDTRHDSPYFSFNDEGFVESAEILVRAMIVQWIIIEKAVMIITSLFVGFGIINVAIPLINMAGTNNSHFELNQESLVASAVRMCPSANICRQERTDRGLESCCGECSCDERCHDNLNCCFPPYGNGREFQTCIHPSDPLTGKHWYVPPYMYFMTTKCPTNVQHLKPEYKDCGNTSVAFWGSLYPVYSSTTKQIYKNSVCAECNGITDGVYWDIVVGHTCPMFPTIISPTCYIWFQRNLELIRSERCGVTSNRTDFDIPPQLDTVMSKKDILDACHSELVDHYYGRGFVYKNVFCAICDSDAMLLEPQICGRPVILRQTFSWVMNEQYILDSIEFRADPGVTYPLVCSTDSNQTVDECQELHCPYGQFYDSGFQCLHVVNYWNIDGYSIGLRIHLNQAMTVFDVQDEADLKNWLKSPWPNRWSIQYVYYDQGVSFAHLKDTPSLIVLMQATRKMRHKFVLDDVEKYLSRTWQIDIGNVTIETRAQFLEYKRIIWSHISPVTGKRYKHSPDWWYVLGPLGLLSMRDQPTIEEISLTRIYRPKFSSIYRKIVVTKLHFCPTVQVNVSTKWLNDIGDGVKYSGYIEYNGRAIFSAEFEIIENEQVLICLEDSPYRYGLPSSSNRLHNLSVYTVFVSIVHYAYYCRSNQYY